MREQSSRRVEIDPNKVLSLMGMPNFSIRMLKSSDNAVFDPRGRIWIGSGVSQEKIRRIADSYALCILDNIQNIQNYEIN